jgi:hydrogenase maturation protease
MTAKVLVAGVGNIFLGDDGFGVEVARRLGAERLGDGVKVADFGIRGVHLAYELLEGYDLTILVDAAPRGGDPGTVYVIEPDLRPMERADGLIDAHGMEPDSVFALLATLGGVPGRVLVVGCEPQDTSERIGLSVPVASAVDQAVGLIAQLIHREEE